MHFVRWLAKVLLSPLDFIQFKARALMRQVHLLRLEIVNIQIAEFDGEELYMPVQKMAPNDLFTGVNLSVEYLRVPAATFSKLWWSRFWELREKRNRIIDALCMHERNAVLL